MELNNRSYAADGAHSDLDTGLEESMWHLGLKSNNKDWVYPERPGAQDCGYYIRTGYCGYGLRCRYNHPRDRGVISKAPGFIASGHPEHASQPVCQNFLKTGACRFGSTCKYHHPRQVGGSISLNCHGYRLRQGEKDCPYYVKTGQCKFGSACKFHHPEPISSFFPPPPPAVNPMVQFPLVPSPQQYPSLASWQVGRPMSSTTHMRGLYGPVYISSSIVPVPGWSPYLGHLIPGGQHMIQAGLSYEPPNQYSPSLSDRFSHFQKEFKLPDRPGQPLCHYYIKTGVCKFGTRCRYHHPPESCIPNSTFVLGPLGLPLRPGAQPCPHQARHGVCKSGPACKYDHPVGVLSYNTPPPSSLSDPRAAPHHLGFSSGNLAPSAYPQLQPCFIIPNKENAVT